MEVKLPNFLYKFLPLNKTFDEKIHESDGTVRCKNGFDAIEDILVNNKIYYSKPKYFNDPFEFDGVILKFVNGDNNRKIAYDLLHRFGFISFSSRNDNILMWSHYADAHRGVCVRFKCVEDPFFDEDGAGRVVKVEYGNKIVEKENSILSDRRAVFEKMSRKACCWSYEREFRIFKVPSSVKSDDAYGNHNFNSTLVDAVYFGLKTEDSEKIKVRGIIDSAKHEISVYKAVKNKT